jgi:dihydrofolate reductase
VLTHDLGYHPEGVEVAYSLDEAIGKAEGDDVFIIGGAKVFDAALSRASRIYETRVHATVQGDTSFDPDLSHWLEEDREEHRADIHNPYDYTYITYVKEL